MKNAKQFVKYLQQKGYNDVKIENGKIVVGGWLDLRNTKITSLPDNLTVGGSLDLSGTAITNPNYYKNLQGTIINDRWVYVDGVLSKIKGEPRQVGEYKVYDAYFEKIITDGKYYAHAKTFKQGVIDIRFKKANRDVSQFENLKLDSKVSYEDAIVMYRIITGACSGGTESFLNNHNFADDKQYTIAEIIESTKGQYGSDTFRNFFAKG
ncbi:MAG: hypothetical protein EOM74_05820 [Methanomicrobia archaeon]|nr:hypothetical protein [Methanomicrobia archaeon]